MRAVFALLLGLLMMPVLPAQVAAQLPPVDQTRCIFAAAMKLPPIPGMEITGSKIVDLPADLKSKPAPGEISVAVEIDVSAAARKATFLFVCGTAAGKPIFAVPAGIVR